MKKLILLSGKKFVGKDTVADYFLTNKMGFTKMALADELKKDLHLFMTRILGLQINKMDLWNPEMKENVVGDWIGKPITLRHMMQWFGQMMREEFGQDYWINKLVDNINTNYFLMSSTNIIVTDCRFEEELIDLTESLCANYDVIIIRIKRDTGSTDTHISEVQLDSKPDSDFDYVIENNGTIEELNTKLDDLYKYICS